MTMGLGYFRMDIKPFIISKGFEVMCSCLLLFKIKNMYWLIVSIDRHFRWSKPAPRGHTSWTPSTTSGKPSTRSWSARQPGRGWRPTRTPRNISASPIQIWAVENFLTSELTELENNNWNLSLNAYSSWLKFWKPFIIKLTLIVLFETVSCIIQGWRLGGNVPAN